MAICFNCKKEAKGMFVSLYHDGSPMEIDPCCHVCGEILSRGHEEGWGGRGACFVPFAPKEWNETSSRNMWYAYTDDFCDEMPETA